MQNAVVYRCVRMIAEAAASVPVLLYDGPNEIESHPLLDLIGSPSPHQTGPEFLESFFGYLLVSGNAYVEAVALNGQLRELHVLRPDRMTILPGPDGWPEGYTYTAAGGQVTFSQDVVPGVRPVLHMRLFHPVDDHYGLSPLEAAATAIDSHNQASKWNKALLDNAARPSGALVYAAREGRLSPEQFERLKTELQDGFQGAKNAGRPLLLEGGLDWKPLSLTPAEMDFTEAKHSAAREIALALGVPPMLLGIPGDNTFSNYAEAQRTFWRNTVLPLAAKAHRALADWLVPAYGTTLQLRADLDQIEALAPEREALWSRLNAATFLTPEEKRSAAGYGPKPVTKFNPWHDDRGRFTFGPDGGGDVIRIAKPGGAGKPPPKPPAAPPAAAQPPKTPEPPKPGSPSPAAQPGKTPLQPQGFDPTNLPDKLEKYLLNPDNPQNQGKAGWFKQALGFDQSNWKQLADQLKFDEATAIKTESGPYGQKYQQVIPIKGANGRSIEVPFIFIKDVGTGVVRLVTGFPVSR